MEKSSGYGKFETIQEDVPQELLTKLNTSQANMILSSSMATKQELDDMDLESSSYMIVRRGGFIYSQNNKIKPYTPERKKTMYFFKSGSIFKTQYNGDIFRVDENFEHPVYKYSKPLWMEVTV